MARMLVLPTGCATSFTASRLNCVGSLHKLLHEHCQIECNFLSVIPRRENGYSSKAGEAASSRNSEARCPSRGQMKTTSRTRIVGALTQRRRLNPQMHCVAHEISRWPGHVPSRLLFFPNTILIPSMMGDETRWEALSPDLAWVFPGFHADFQGFAHKCAGVWPRSSDLPGYNNNEK
jgi:hypothetical protein